MIPECWKTNEVNPVITLVLFLKKIFRLWSRYEKLMRILVDSVSKREVINILGRPRELKFTEQYSREEKATHRDNFGDM